MVGRRPSGGRWPNASAIYHFQPRRYELAKEMNLLDMDRISKDFTDAAVLQEAGFDAVERTAGMDIVVAVLCPYTNRRVDEYGGYDPRRRLSGITHRLKPLALRRIRRNVGEDFPVFVKFNVHDGFEQGIQIDVVTAARESAKAGASMLIPSGGFVL